jgi:hypothetical protein
MLLINTTASISTFSALQSPKTAIPAAATNPKKLVATFEAPPVGVGDG